MPSQRDRDRSFARWLTLIAVEGLSFRVGAAFWYEAHAPIVYDGLWYLGVARFVASGIGFRDPIYLIMLHQKVATAAHPPLYPLFLSAMDFLGLHSVLTHRLWSCVPGTLTVVFVGITARDLAGRRAGLVAAACGAGFISLVSQDVILWSEGFFGMTIALVVLLSYRYLRQPSTVAALQLSGAVTLSVLTRAESALLYVALVVPLVVIATPSARARGRALLGSALVAALMLAPWMLYNANRFDHPVVLSTGLGGLLASSNCAAAYDGPQIGSWIGGCARGLPHNMPTDESKSDPLLRQAAFRYMSHHPGRLPVVVPVRLLRTFGIWNPRYQFRHDLFLDAAGLRWVANVAAAQYWIYFAVGVAGLIALRRKRHILVPVLAPVFTVVAISVAGYGTLRFRVALDALLPVLVGVGAMSLVARAQQARISATGPWPWNRVRVTDRSISKIGISGSE